MEESDDEYTRTLTRRMGGNKPGLGPPGNLLLGEVDSEHLKVQRKSGMATAWGKSSHPLSVKMVLHSGPEKLLRRLETHVWGEQLAYVSLVTVADRRTRKVSKHTLWVLVAMNPSFASIPGIDQVLVLDTKMRCKTLNINVTQSLKAKALASGRMMLVERR